MLNTFQKNTCKPFYATFSPFLLFFSVLLIVNIVFRKIIYPPTDKCPQNINDLSIKQFFTILFVLLVLGLILMQTCKIQNKNIRNFITVIGFIFLAWVAYYLFAMWYIGDLWLNRCNIPKKDLKVGNLAAVAPSLDQILLIPYYFANKNFQKYL